MTLTWGKSNFLSRDSEIQTFPLPLTDLESLPLHNSIDKLKIKKGTTFEPFFMKNVHNAYDL